MPRSPIWFAVMLAFFSLGGNKGDYYLVVMPAFVPSIAERIGRTRFRLELVPSVWLVVIAVLWMRIPLPIGPYALPEGTRPRLRLRSRSHWSP